MTLDESTTHIEACVQEMAEVYGETIFDEWAVIGLMKTKLRANSPRLRRECCQKQKINVLSASRGELHR